MFAESMDSLQSSQLLKKQQRALIALQAFADGSLGSSTALFHEPYADDPTNSGLAVAPEDWLMRNVVAADAAGLQVGSAFD